MYNEDTDVLFPPRIIPLLQELRGDEWSNLVDQVRLLTPLDTKRIAFVLLMIRLGSCASCHADSFRAMRGCTQCATQTVKRFRGSDQELLKLYDEAKMDIVRYIENGN